MTGYTPVFRSIFEGSLCGQYPDTAAWLFLLALSDKNGHVDKTPQYISAVTGMPVEELLGCIERFMQPDPVSRSDIEEGRRLVLIDPNRNWGWRIVNHARYREKARLEAKNAKEIVDRRNLERMRYRREGTQGPPLTAEDRREPPVTDPAYSDTNTNAIIQTQQHAPDGSVRAPRKRRPTKTELPEQFGLTEERKLFILAKIPDADPGGLVAAFNEQAKAKGWTYADWDQAFQVYVRNCTPGSGHFAAGQYPRRGQKWSGIQWQ